MKPTITLQEFGSVSIDDKQINYDIFIDIEGHVIKQEIGSSTSVDFLELTLEEAGTLYDPAANEMIIGSGERSELRLSNEAYDFFDEKRCKIKLLPTNEAIEYWNRYEGHAIGLFHFTN